MPYQILTSRCRLQIVRDRKLPRILLSLAVAFLMVATGPQPCTSQPLEGDLAFGVTQVHESEEAIWIFLDLEIVADVQGSGPAHKQKLAFAAVKVKANHEAEVFTSCDPLLTAHSHQMRFRKIEGTVHAVRRDLSAAWKFPHAEDRSASISSISVEDFMPGGRATLQAALEQDAGKAFRLKATGNFGYGVGPIEAFESETLGIRVEYQGAAGKLGWNRLTIAFDGVPQAIVFSVNELLPECAQRRR